MWRLQETQLLKRLLKNLGTVQDPYSYMLFPNNTQLTPSMLDTTVQQRSRSGLSQDNIFMSFTQIVRGFGVPQSHFVKKKKKNNYIPFSNSYQLAGGLHSRRSDWAQLYISDLWCSTVVSNQNGQITFVRAYEMKPGNRPLQWCTQPPYVSAVVWSNLKYFTDSICPGAGLSNSIQISTQPISDATET